MSDGLDAEYRVIFEAISDGLVVNDPDTGLVVEVNPAFCRMHGLAREEIIGRHPDLFIHPDSRPTFPRYLDAVRSGYVFRGRAWDLRQDGKAFAVEVQGSLFPFRGRPHVLGVVRDVTVEVRAKEELERRVEERTRELSSLLDVARDVSSTLELQPLLTLILDHLKAVADYAGSSILVEEGGDWVIIADRVDAASDRARVNAVGIRFDASRIGYIERAIRAGEPVIIADVRGDSEAARSYRTALGDLLETPGFRHVCSWLGVPLKLQDRVFGLISLSSEQPDSYTAHHARLAMGIAAIAASAIENARLYERAKELAVMQERARLARDLHDSVTQSLFSLGIMARAARTQHDRGAPALTATLDRIGTLAQEALTEMRALLFELRPDALIEEGLRRALERLVASYRARSDLDVSFTATDDTDQRLSPESETAIFRIAQEALSNAAKHAHAATVAVTLTADRETLTLTVRDSGKGFDSGAEHETVSEAPGASGFGLRIMRERAATAGLNLRIESAPGAGTRVTVTASLPAQR